MKKILLALALSTIALSAFAQGNPTCPTRPAGDSSNACASTAFVQNSLTTLPLTYGNVFVGNSSNVAVPTPNPTIGVPGTLAGSLSWTGAGSPLQAQYFRFGQPFACTTTYGLAGGGWRQLTSTSTDFSSSFSNIYQCYNYNFLATSGTYNNGNVAIGSDADYSINAPNLFYTGMNALQLVKGTIVGGNAIQTDASPITYWYHQTNLTSVGGANYFPTNDSLMSHFFFSGDSNNAGVNGGPVIYAILGVQASNTATATPRGTLYIGTADNGPSVSTKLLVNRGLYMTGFVDPGVGNIAGGFIVGTNFSNYSTPTYGIDLIAAGNLAVASIKQTTAAASANLVLTNSSNHSIAIEAVGSAVAGGERGAIFLGAVEVFSFDMAGSGSVTIKPGSLTVGVTGVQQGAVAIAGATSGSAVLSTLAVAGTPAITFGTSSGTPAVTASSPLAISTATGNITCTACVVPNTAVVFTTVTFTPIAVGSLPACGAGTKGMNSFVNDSNAASFTAGIGAVVAAGGATNVPVVCDGTNWRIG